MAFVFKLWKQERGKEHIKTNLPLIFCVPLKRYFFLWESLYGGVLAGVKATAAVAGGECGDDTLFRGIIEGCTIVCCTIICSAKVGGTILGTMVGGNMVGGTILGGTTPSKPVHQRWHRERWHHHRQCQTAPSSGATL